MAGNRCRCPKYWDGLDDAFPLCEVCKAGFDERARAAALRFLYFTWMLAYKWRGQVAQAYMDLLPGGGRLEGLDSEVSRGEGHDTEGGRLPG